MSKSAASPVGSNDALDLKSQLADYCLWEEPERGVSIYLNPETVDRLQVEVLRGVETFSGGEGEVGGILIGRTELDGERVITLIEDFAPVPRTYRNGPLYCLSEKDYANFEAALARCSSDTRDLSVMGYYRSHNRDDLYLSSDDLKLIQKYFREPDKVFLLVKTLPSRACTAGFFFWEDGHIQTEFTYLEVPFGPIQSFPAAELARPAGIRVVESLTRKEEGSNQKLPTVEALELPESVRQNRRLWIMRGVAVTVAAVMLTFAGSYWQTRRSRGLGASTPAVRSLGLHIGRKADSLAVTWDRNSPEILAAQRAALYIRDGNNQKTLDLDVSQLRAGVISYAPAGDDLQFRLETYQGGKPNSVESVHLLMPAPSLEVSSSETVGSARLARSKETSAVKRSSRDKMVIAPMESNTSSQAPPESALTVKPIEKQQSQPIAPLSSSVSSHKPFRFMAPAHSPQPTNEVQLDQPPSIPVETKISESTIKFPAVGVEAPPPPNPTKPAIERRPLAQGEAPLTPVTPAPSAKAVPSQPPRVTSFVGPQLIRQVNPAIPAQLRSMISPGLNIEVAVTIDVDGNVSNAKLVSTNGAGVRLIENEVLQAARLFRFRPAQDNHGNVESQMVLTFHFTGGPAK